LVHERAVLSIDCLYGGGRSCKLEGVVFGIFPFQKLFPGFGVVTNYRGGGGDSSMGGLPGRRRRVGETEAKKEEGS
jgi:hypothetical protein